jgi:hypothetical protein
MQSIPEDEAQAMRLQDEAYILAVLKEHPERTAINFRMRPSFANKRAKIIWWDWRGLDNCQAM